MSVCVEKCVRTTNYQSSQKLNYNLNNILGVHTTTAMLIFHRKIKVVQEKSLFILHTNHVFFSCCLMNFHIKFDFTRLSHHTLLIRRELGLVFIFKRAALKLWSQENSSVKSSLIITSPSWSSSSSFVLFFIPHKSIRAEISMKQDMPG